MTADQQLEHRLRIACTQLELVAWGTTPSYNSNGSRSSEHPGGRQPGQTPIVFAVRYAHVYGMPGDPQHYRAEYQRADTYMQRLYVVELAEKAAAAATAPPARTGKEGSVTLQDLVIEDDVGWSPQSIAKIRGVTESQVRRWRQQARRHPETGEPWESDITREVLALAADGGTCRSIALRLSVGKSTVARILQRHGQRAA